MISRAVRVALLSCLLSVVACSAPKKILILHTNDMHASFLPHEAFWVKDAPKPLVGGMKELAWTIDSIRSAGTPSILLDAGDVMTGSPISDLEYRGVSGGALFAMMGMLRYDAWEIGNHDLDISQDNLRSLTTIAPFPTLSANLTDSAGARTLNNTDALILTAGGVRIGVVGVMTERLFEVTNTNNLRGLKVGSAAEAVQRAVDRLKDSVDIMIALSHRGADEDSALAAATHGLSAIIGGHSHTRLRSPKLVNGVIICQAGSNCENLGVLELTVDGKTVSAYNGQLIQLWKVHTPAQNALSGLVDEYDQRIQKEYGGTIGQLSADWKRSGREESNIGNFVADAMREGAAADFAITNSSGIRKDLSAGPITKLDMFEILPFRNVLCTFILPGREVLAFARRTAEALAQGRMSTQTSGLKVSWKSTPGGIDITGVVINGSPLDTAKTYTCATSDFAVNQGDKYLGVVPGAVLYLPTTVFQALVAKVEREKTIDSRIEHRFVEVH